MNSRANSTHRRRRRYERGLGLFLNNAQGVIGQNVVSPTSVAVGTATVTGNGSTWTNTGNLNLGGLQAGVAGGTGILNINSGGTVVSNGATNFWSTPSTITLLPLIVTVRETTDGSPPKRRFQ